MWPDPLLLRGDPAHAILQQLKGPEGAFHEIPVVEHLARSGPARLPESQAGDAGGFVMRWRKKLPGEAGVCTELRRTEGHSEGVSTSAELRANRAPRTRLRE